MCRARVLLCAALVLSEVGADVRAAEPTFAEITGATPRTHEQSRALMAAWVRAHPDDPRAPRGLVWMAQLHVADHERELARPYFLRVYREFPGTEWSLHGLKGLADLDMDDLRFGAAIAKYETLAQSRLEFFQYVGKMAAMHARDVRRRFYVTLGLGAGFVLLWALRLWRIGAGKALWPPPAELIYPLPLLVLMAVASFGATEGEGKGVLALVLGAVVLLWLNGAYLRARAPVGVWRLCHGAFGLLQAGALLYVAIVLTGLWDKFHDTLEMGAD